ncbi:MAG: HAD-IA family hydrolase [Candidatus Zixiibacteriota bacterium]
MIKALVSDFSRVLLFPKDKNFTGSLNEKYRELLKKGDLDFFESFELNKELLDFYQSLTKKLDLYILTSESIQEAPELQPFLKPTFKEIFSAKKLGVSKKEPSTYKLIADKIGVKTTEILYLDDNQENIKAASASGIKAVLFINNQLALKELASLS